MSEEIRPIVDKNEIHLAMLGMVDGNGHPYSWSAIFNGYDPGEMAKCPFPAIPAYLDREPEETLRIPDVRVTTIWTDNPSDAKHVSKASLIPKIVENPGDVIGEVDAVIIATDKGHEHVERCRPFVEAGLPIFVDKPLVDNEDDLRTFNAWIKEGKPIMSSSCMRYCKEFMPYHVSTHDLGEVRLVTITTPKSWERYGIHALEGVYPILDSGFVSARNTGSIERNIVHFTHKSGTDLIVAAVSDMFGAFGVLELYGTRDSVRAAFSDTFFAFKKQLEAFISFLRTGIRPFPYSETEELMKMLIAGIRSREEAGREVYLSEIESK